MAIAKLFKSGGSQAVRLPKDFRFKGTEIIIERRGDLVVLKNMPQKFKSLNEAARFFAKHHPEGANFPDIPRPKKHERSIADLSW